MANPACRMVNPTGRVLLRNNRTGARRMLRALPIPSKVPFRESFGSQPLEGGKVLNHAASTPGNNGPAW
jgi:hypothetical protein